MPPIQHIDVQTFAQWRQQGKVHTLLDVREPFEVACASIVPSIHIPLSHLIDEFDMLDLTHPIVVLCHHGLRSLSACVLLSKMEANDVFNLSGGIDRWARLIDESVGVY